MKTILTHKIVLPLLLFVLTQCVYLLTMSHSIGYWDSPEFAVTGSLLQNSHPPGSPFYGLIISFFSLLLFFINDTIILTNYVSTIFGSLIGVVVYLIVNHCIRNFFNNLSYVTKNTARFGGILAALSLCFSHSFWFIATETEVYSLSFFLFVILIYITLLTFGQSQTFKKKSILLMALIFGLACGVHSIILLAIIPVGTFLYLSQKNIRLRSVLYGILIGLMSFVLFYFVLFYGTLNLLHRIEINLVNTIGLNQNEGALLGLLLLFIFTGTLIFYAHTTRNSRLYWASFVVFFFLLGNTVNITLILRSKTNTPYEQGVSNIVKLQYYLKASQFGVDKIPLVYGSNYNAPTDPLMPFKYDNESFYYDEIEKKYLKTHRNKNMELNYDKKFGAFFPRMFHKSSTSDLRYPLWTEIQGTPISHFNGDKKQEINKITFSENLAFFFNYQINWLYLRYVMWNLVGVQNHLHGTGNVLYGNWQSGISFLDTMRLGKTEDMPNYLKVHPTINVYYFIPLVFCILGFFFLFKNKKLALFFTFLFLIFGIGIIVLVNPVPASILVRERDYIFVGSFIILFLFVGFSFPWINGIFKKILPFNHPLQEGFLFSIVLLLIPIQFLIKNWDDHDRTHDYFLEVLAKSYLDNCPKDAILITYGDNMTFPLQYLQQIQKYRTDITLINYDLLNLDWYAKGLSEWDQNLAQSGMRYLAFNPMIYPKKVDTERPIALRNLVAFVSNDSTKINFGNSIRNYVPVTNFKIQFQLDNFKQQPLLNAKTHKAEIVETLTWSYNKTFYTQNDLILMDLIANNFEKRPICFLDNGSSNHHIGLEKYFVLNGNINQLLPLVRSAAQGNPKIVNTVSYEKLLLGNNDKTKYEKPFYMTSHYQEYIRKILRKNHYFLAQSQLEKGERLKAKETLDRSFIQFPNSKAPFQEYAFAMGKLYYRLGESALGKKVCSATTTNILQEIHWIVNAQPGNSIINAKHLDELKNKAFQMLEQFNQLDSKAAEKLVNQYNTLTPKINTYLKTYWPYF